METIVDSFLPCAAITSTSSLATTISAFVSPAVDLPPGDSVLLELPLRNQGNGDPFLARFPPFTRPLEDPSDSVVSPGGEAVFRLREI